MLPLSCSGIIVVYFSLSFWLCGVFFAACPSLWLGRAGLLSAAVWRLLLQSAALGAQASVLAVCGLSGCHARAQSLPRTWDPPRPGVKPVP